MRWGALCAVALAFLSAGPAVDATLQPLAHAAPWLGERLPGGELRLHVTLHRDQGLPTDANVDCVDLRIEPSGSGEQPLSFVCPRWTTDAVLVAPKARGTLVATHNGTAHRIPFTVAQGARGTAWLEIGTSGLSGTDFITAESSAPSHAWLWLGAIHGALLLAFAGLLAIGHPLKRLVAVLAVASVLWIPLWGQGVPHMPGGLLMLAWGVVVAETFWRMPDQRPVA